MHRPLRQLLVGIGIYGLTLALGCRHCHHNCDCCQVTPCPPQTVVSLPSPPSPPTVVATPVALTPVPKPEEIKKPEPPPANILVNNTVYSSVDGKPGSATGTLELTAAEAEALGVRPGHTPGALFLPEAPAYLPPKIAEQGNPAGEQEKPEKSNAAGSSSENN
jgi:hypothetical protein